VSAENVQAASEIFETACRASWESGDWLARYDPDVVYHPREDEPDTRLCVGREAWAQIAAGFMDAFSEITFDVKDTYDAGDLMLRYSPGDWNALHQDLYGEVAFPFQIVTVLDRPGRDFEGGEFVLLEQRPRAQSRAHVQQLRQGAFLIFTTRQRPVHGSRGFYRAAMRHGVSTVTAGQRTALGVIFHDAA
jgi:hypothetical protein